MSQSANSTFQGLTAAKRWAPECLIAIAGWPTLYSVNLATYTLADLTTGGDKLSQFTSIKAIADYPAGAGASFKGSRPEEGGQTIGTLKAVLNDARISGALHATDLISRAAYLFGYTGTPHTTTLVGAITPSATSLTLSDATNFSNGSLLYVGQECILLAGKSGNSFSGCTRGYLLTDATAHATGVKVYDFMPNLYRRSIYAFKGYQSLTSTASFLRAFGGVITDASKDRTKVTINAAANTWEMYAAGSKKIVNILDTTLANQALYEGTLTTGVASQAITGIFGTLSADTFSGDYTCRIFTSLTDPTILGDGHYMMKVGDSWFGIVSATQVGTSKFVDLSIVKGIANSPHTIENAEGSQVSFGWTNATFSSTAAPTPDEVPKLILKLLLSVKGDGANDATYDVFQTGIGLGIPAGKVDQTTFTGIMSGLTYDANQRVVFAFTEPVDAKKFIEDELCKPFGYSLVTGNDGKIKLINHRSPELVYIAAGNHTLTVKTPTGGQASSTTLLCNAYTPADMATEVARALNAGAGSGWTCTYSTTTNKFTIANATAFDIVSSASGWSSLGFTSDHTSVTSIAGDATVCANTALAQVNGAAAILTENDLVKGSLQQQPNTDLRLSSVTFYAGYDFVNDVYASQKRYIDAEAVNLGDSLGTRDFSVKSKGAIHSGDGLTVWHPFSVIIPPVSGCTGTRVNLSALYGLDTDSSYAHSFAMSLLHRYKQPPLVLKAKLFWTWNTLEVGDCIKLNYTPTGVVSDPELDAERVYQRVFEVVSATPDYKGATVDVTLIGHRWQGAY